MPRLSCRALPAAVCLAALPRLAQAQAAPTPPAPPISTNNTANIFDPNRAPIIVIRIGAHRLVLAEPRPTIPDDLRDSDLNSTFDALFTIHADGTASVKMVSSTGNQTLDALALDAAKRWTFRPATRGGQPVESFLRLRVEFEVS